MFEKVFGYILSLRKRKRLRMLELIHKMPDSEPLEKALAYCSFYAQYPVEELAVKDRIRKKILCSVASIDALDDELFIIGSMVLEEDKRQKYYERLPSWSNTTATERPLDDLLQVSAFVYYDMRGAIATLENHLRRIKEGIEMPHNEKMKSYYTKKPGVVYREAVNILRQII